jgi:hypothetical protein
VTTDGSGTYQWTCPPAEEHWVIDMFGGRSSDGTPGEHIRTEVVLEPGKTYTFTVGPNGAAVSDGH